MVGNAGNGSSSPTNVVNSTGVQLTTPGGSAEATVVGQQSGNPVRKSGSH